MITCVLLPFNSFFMEKIKIFYNDIGIFFQCLTYFNNFFLSCGDSKCTLKMFGKRANTDIEGCPVKKKLRKNGDSKAGFYHFLCGKIIIQINRICG